jgi:hypothetical protein
LVAFIGAVAAASFAALLAAIAEFVAELAEAIAALASDAAAFASAEAVLASLFLQAATETAATAAPTIRIVRSVPEVMFLVPVWMRLAAPFVTLGCNMPGYSASARDLFTAA